MAELYFQNTLFPILRIRKQYSSNINKTLIFICGEALRIAVFVQRVYNQTRLNPGSGLPCRVLQTFSFVQNNAPITANINSLVSFSAARPVAFR